MIPLIVGVALASVPWSIDTPVDAGGATGKGDAAVVVDIETYRDPRIAPVMFAERDATAFAGWLVNTRGLAPDAVTRLRSPTRSELLVAVAQARARAAAGQVWVYFAGHGWHRFEVGKPGEAGVLRQVLVMADAGPSPGSWVDTGVGEEELWAAVGRGQVVVDACFEGTERDEALVDPGSRFLLIDHEASRVALSSGGATPGVWRAASPGQVALPFRAAGHGLFTFLWLGGARGWADGVSGTRDGQVTSGELAAWLERVTGTGADVQRPSFSGDMGMVLASGSELEVGPTVAEIQAWLPFLARNGEQFVGDVDDWIAWRRAQDTWLGKQTRRIQQDASASWRRTKRYLDAGSPHGVGAVTRYIETWRGRAVEREGEFSFVPIPELEAAWIALGPPRDTGLPGLGDEMVPIPGGWSRVGSPTSEWGRETRETERIIQVAAFEMARTEVSQGLFAQYKEGVFAEFAEVGGVKVDLRGYSRPAQHMNWCEAAGFANWMTLRWNEAHPAERRTLAYTGVDTEEELRRCIFDQNTGREVSGATGFRLPTADEWEHAARAGVQTSSRGVSVPYVGSADLEQVCVYANVMLGTVASRRVRYDPFWNDGFPCQDGHLVPAPVASFRPNLWGLYDMTGNVAELTQSYLSAQGEQPEVAADDYEYTVFRGGSWQSGVDDARVAQWDADFFRDFRRESLGLRLARSLP